MSDIKWIKVITDIFEDEKIKLIKSMPEGRTLVLIWFQLLIQAGKTNASGWVYLSEGCGYTPAMFATLFNESQQMIELALNLFSSKPFEMIEMSQDGMIYIPNWEKHQNVEGMDKIRERERLRKARQRERKKLTENVNLLHLSQGQGGTSHGTSHQSPTTEIEVELDKDIKRLYMDNVSMTETQYSKLIELMGEETAFDYMERYNVWITTRKPLEQKRRCSYASIRKWYTDDQKKKSNKTRQSQKVARMEVIDPEREELLNRAYGATST